MIIETWILTFDRPAALNRLISNFNKQGIIPSVLSNHPDCFIDERNTINDLVINTLNSKFSNAWTARSWNTMLMKSFEKTVIDGVILIQDDTDIGPNFEEWFSEAILKFDFISGPAGDQFFSLKREVLKKVGWFDERYIGAYCADADFFKRVYLEWDKDRVSIQDSHNWGFNHNVCGLSSHIITELQSKQIGGNYENQHWAIEKLGPVNKTLLHSQNHYKSKWGHPLDCNQPCINWPVKLIEDIDWYPWFSTKYGFTCY